MIADRVNDIQTQLQSINSQLQGLQNQAQPLRDTKTALLAELSDLQAVLKNYASFTTWKAAQP